MSGWGKILRGTRQLCEWWSAGGLGIRGSWSSGTEIMLCGGVSCLAEWNKWGDCRGGWGLWRVWEAWGGMI